MYHTLMLTLNVRCANFSVDSTTEENQTAEKECSSQVKLIDFGCPSRYKRQRILSEALAVP